LPTVRMVIDVSKSVAMMSTSVIIKMLKSKVCRLHSSSFVDDLFSLFFQRVLPLLLLIL